MRILVYHILDESNFASDLLTSFGRPVKGEDSNPTEASERHELTNQFVEEIIDPDISGPKS